MVYPHGLSSGGFPPALEPDRIVERTRERSV
jgi:hypothetical protein